MKDLFRCFVVGLLVVFVFAFTLTPTPTSTSTSTPLLPVFVNGLAPNKARRGPRSFTKLATLPPLDIIPGVAGIGTNDKDNDATTAMAKTIRDYSAPLPITYTNDLSSAEEWVSSNLKRKSSSSSDDGPLMLGWDMESSPYLPWKEHTYTKNSYFGPATLQLSTPDSALVIQIAQDGFGPIHDNGLPQFLHDLLDDPGVIPVGVGIDDDLVELYRWCLEHGDDCAGPAWGGSRNSNPDNNNFLQRFDMGGIGLDPDVNTGRTIGLARLVAGILGVVLPKSKQLARTHWSMVPPLSRLQVAYAARDAWAGAAIMSKLGALDTNRFDPSLISESLLEQSQIIINANENDATSGNNEQQRQQRRPLRSIQQISNRQFLRKAAKDEWKELRNPSDADGNEKPPWTEAQNERYALLTKEIKDLAPTPPMRYEITKSLGLEIPR